MEMLKRMIPVLQIVLCVAELRPGIYSNYCWNYMLDLGCAM
jgi:hypothetical protein